MKKFILLTFLFSRFLFSEPSYITFPSNVNWKVRETDHFNVLFRSGQEKFSERAGLAAEHAYRLLIPIFKEAPDKTWLILADFQDSTNGYSLDFPYPHIVVFASPPTAAGQLSNMDDWLVTLIMHEYVHTLHLYPAHGLWSVLHTIFGTWVVPNGMMPSHFHEGMATHFETELSQGGRGRGNIFKMFQRKAVEKGNWGNSFAPLDVMDGAANRWPLGIAPYFFGYTLHKELAKRKNSLGLYTLEQSYSSNWPYFINSPLEEVYGLDYKTLWSEIFDKTKKESEAEIAKIKTAPLSTLKYLTKTGFYKSNVTLSPDGNKAAYHHLSQETGNIFAIINTLTGKVEEELNLGSGDGDGSCWVGNSLFFIAETKTNQNSINRVARYDFTNKKTTIFQNETQHIHRLACSKKSFKLLVYEEVATKGKLKEFNWDDKNDKLSLHREWEIPEGTWVGGVLVAEQSWFSLRVGLHSHLYQWKESQDPIRFMTIPSHLFNFRLGKEGLLAISGIDGRDEVWEIYPQKKSMKKKIALIGGTSSFDYSPKGFFIASYEENGFDMAWASETNHPEKSVPQKIETKAQLDLPAVSSSVVDYSPISTLRPRTWIPSVLFVPDGYQIGAWIPSFDASQRHFYDIYGGYDSRGLPFANLNYSYRFGEIYTFDLNANYLPSYLQSSQKFLKQWGGSLGLSAQLASWLPTIRVSPIFRRLESTPNYNDAFQSVGAGVGLRKKFGFSNRPNSISPVNGVDSSIDYAYYLKSLGSDSNYYTISAAIDQYWEAFFWKESVFYLGSRVGFTENSPLANYFYQGGGELMFYQGRGSFLNRGFLSGTFISRRIFNVNLEYRFPIAQIERGLGLSPFFLKRIHAAIVADTTTLSNDFFKRFYYSVGFEVKMNWKLFYYLPTQFRAGVYHGFADPNDRFGRFAKNLYYTVGIEAGL